MCYMTMTQLMSLGENPSNL
uniref:Uncharacterized protein n=1 Tax=Anguilla anguilla TaxID=7936 RepID=A0A0E9VKN5_ANGAN